MDIYARVSYRVRKEKREPSTEGQVAVCRARLADLGLGKAGSWSTSAGRRGTRPSSARLGMS